MPTRPVSWDLDAPPPSLLGPARKASPASEVPSLRKLRKSLVGARFELLKVSMFAAFLLAVVGIAIHGSHLGNLDNQFAANAASAIKAMTTAVSSRSAALHAGTEALTLAAVHNARALLGRATVTPSSPATIPKTDVAAVRHVAHVVPVIHGVRSVHPGRVDLVSREPHSEGVAIRNNSSIFKDLLAPDSLVAGITALFLYIVFVVVLVRKKGGLRAFSRSHAV